ncbi:unnamed protein product [Paramecium octaurelia]|uniref:Uncharacterized protein n=1 Tax=Paramecium octaurelia TaxID=43137 RepID=A0A8S1XPJ6_PAROT|nr:unnamed protein product [Paramecium octaurelia]CAD8203034.1 unnamed protein product [Paramecium octaurelia]
MINEYERIKFIFPRYEKFIIMDFNTKIALEDVKFTFVNVLKVDLFARKLVFLITKGLIQTELDSQKSLQGQTVINKLKQEKSQIEIVVKFLEDGA